MSMNTNLFKSFGGSLDSNLSGVAGSRSYVTDIDIGSGQLWTPFKTLCNIVNTTIENPNNDNFTLLSQELKKYKNHFQSKQLLTSKGRNNAEREELKKSINEPIHLIGYDSGKVLPIQLVNETILLSDLFDINEFLALDLLVTGEAEMENFPCWGRGLIAVYIYFEGQFSVVSVIRTMLQVSPGNTWASKAHPKIIDTFSSVLDNILTEDFMDKALSLIDKYAVKKQITALDAHLGLGDWRHRTGVQQFITSIRETLAEIIFYWSAQRGLGWHDTLRILEYLKSHLTLTEDYKISKEDVWLLSAVLYSVDFNLGTDKFDRTYLTNIRKYYKDNIDSKDFLCHELLDVLKLAYHIAVHKRAYEASLSSICTGRNEPDTAQSLLGEEILEFKTDVFNFLKIEFFYDQNKFSEESILRLFHQLFSDFIIYMPARLKEFKTVAVEASKMVEMYQDQGLNSPSGRKHQIYENFLETLGAFYSADTRLELAGDYFRSDLSLGALNKLMRSACVDTMGLFAPNAKMLAGIGFSYPSGVMDLLSHSGHNLSLDQFFDSIAKFLKTVGSPLLAEIHIPSTHSTAYQTDMFHRVVLNQAKLNSKETAGICAYLNLMKSVCKKSSNARRHFTTMRRHWFRLILISAKERGFPREIRIDLLDLASSMVDPDTVSTEYVMSLWEVFYSTRFIERGTPDIREELEERETRLESYGLTVNFLKLLDALVATRFSPEVQLDYEASADAGIDGSLLEPYVVFVRETVLQKVPYRTYKDISERWALKSLCMQIISNLLDYVPHLMVQMLCDTPLLRSCLMVLTDCARFRSSTWGSIPEVDECGLICLTLISRVYDRQANYLYRRDLNAAEYHVVLIGIEELLMKVHHETGRPEYLLAILKFVDKLNPELHRDLALQILARIVSTQSDIDAQLYNAVSTDATLAAIIKNTFIECLYGPGSSENVKKDILNLLKCSVVHPSPNFGFFMLNVDKRIEFQQPGVNGYPRTVLHALLDNLSTLPTAFQTLYVLIRDPRLNNPIIRFLRTNQILVKFYMQNFPSPDMEVEAVGYFLKCLALELKSTEIPGPLTHTLVGKYSNKFLSVLQKISIEPEEIELKSFEFFDNEQILEAFRKCEYMDNQFKVKLVDSKKLEGLLIREIVQLDRATLLRLRKSIQGEAKEVVTYIVLRNEARRREASKIFLFECWRQCLEILVLSLSSVRVAGVQYVAGMLQLLTEKAVTGNSSCDSFQRLLAETTTTLCAVLNVFDEDLGTMSGTTLGVIILHLCTWIIKEDVAAIRTLLYAGLLYLMNFSKDKKVDGTIHSSFALVIDYLCKDAQNAADVGKMLSMYLLAEIIRWNISRGLGGVVPTISMKDMEDELEATKAKFGLGPETSFKNDTSLTANRSINANPPHNESGLQSMLMRRQNQNITSASLTSPKNKSMTNGADKSVLTGLVMARTSHLMYSTEAALTSYLHSKGFVKTIILTLSGEDDTQLVHLFSTSPAPAHLRALLIYEAKMCMLTRFASSGTGATQLLLDSSLIRSLLDMQVFYSGCNLVAEYGIRPSFSKSSFNRTSNQLKKVSLPTKLERLDNLFATVLMLFHAMLDTKPKNESGDALIPGIWQFIATHDASLANLLIYPEEDERPTQSLYCLTSLLVLIASESPDDAFNRRSLIFDKITLILREHILSSGDWQEQLHLVRDVMMFLFKYAVRNKRRIRVKGDTACEPILAAKIDYASDIIPTDTAIDLNVGLILKIVHDTAKLAYQIYDNEDQRTTYLVEIIESGLTLIYWHVEMILKDMFATVGDFRRDQLQFQMDLRTTIEGAFLKDLAEAIEIFTHDMEYIKAMLMNIRRLAHLQKY